MNSSVQAKKNMFPILEVDEDTVKRLLKKDPFHPFSCIKEIKVEDGGKQYLLKLFIDNDFVIALEVMEADIMDEPYVEPDDIFCHALKRDYDLMQELLYIAIEIDSPPLTTDKGCAEDTSLYKYSPNFSAGGGLL